MRKQMARTVSVVALAAMIAVLSIPTNVRASESESTGSQITVTGTLTAMSGVSVPASLTLVAGATTYTVEVNSSTHFVRLYNGMSELAEFLVGDTIEVQGTMSNDAANTITAKKIKDNSIQRRGGTFRGSIVTLSCADSTFTYKPKERDQQTVYISTSTKILRGGDKINCVDLKNGEIATVIGVWRPTTNRIDADRIIVHMKTLSGTITSITLTDGGLPAALLVQHKNGQDWIVTVGTGTKLFRRYMGKATIEEFQVGDKIEARGSLGNGLVLNARMVRNNSITVKHRDFGSRIFSIDQDAETFVIKILKKESVLSVTVKTTDETKIYNDDEEVAFSTLGVGTKVKILGEYNSSTQTITATRIHVKD